MDEFGIPMLCGHDIEHKEDVCIVCVIANEQSHTLEYLELLARRKLFESTEALSIIQRFLADAKEAFADEVKAIECGKMHYDSGFESGAEFERKRLFKQIENTNWDYLEIEGDEITDKLKESIS